ncbi:MAG: adenylyl-sulfate kinase [SAR86 cluster bacterium]|uniref:Adenylyl-sulfate kinase n=1 Tax=SAR86 cluster bacterium TaxID=2030880 RepID=A0A2A5C7Q6_9GAMM|nr:MAG: adenylyl-sulfate kinase [SAR86 cluster bacterium]
MTENFKHKSTNIVWHESRVSRKFRQEIFAQQGTTLWFTGLSGSGKSTLAFTLEHKLIEAKFKSYVLDGDNIRHGLNNNLGFTDADREENIRRVGEVSKLFADAGLIVLSSFISPFKKDRQLVRKIHADAGLNFVEIYIDTPLAICEERDPKQLYAKARRGEIPNFTGISSPYEEPDDAEIIIPVSNTPEQSSQQILEYLKLHQIIKH